MKKSLFVEEQISLLNNRINELETENRSLRKENRRLSGNIQKKGIFQRFSDFLNKSFTLEIVFSDRKKKEKKSSEDEIYDIRKVS